MDLENLNRQNFLRQTDSGVTEAPQDDDEIRCIQKVMQVGSATTLGCTNVQKVFRFIPHPNSPFFVSKDFIKWKKIAKNKGWVEVLFWELSAQRYVALAYPTTTLFKISRFFLNGCGEVNFFCFKQWRKGAVCKNEIKVGLIIWCYILIKIGGFNWFSCEFLTGSVFNFTAFFC